MSANLAHKASVLEGKPTAVWLSTVSYFKKNSQGCHIPAALCCDVVWVAVDMDMNGAAQISLHTHVKLYLPSQGR